MAIQLRDVLDGHRYFNNTNILTIIIIRILILEGRTPAGNAHKHVFVLKVVHLVVCIHTVLRGLHCSMQEKETLELTGKG
jgi:hypothetical protein